MNKRRRKKALRNALFIARHEAAHFVAHYRLLPDLDRDQVSIIRAFDSLGRVTSENEAIRVDPETGDAILDLEIAQSACTVYLAGVAADRWIAGLGWRRCLGRGRSDYANVRAWLESLDALQSLPRLEAEAHSFVLSRQFEIEALARELVTSRELDASEAEIIVDVEVGDAQPGDLVRYRRNRDAMLPRQFP